MTFAWPLLLLLLAVPAALVAWEAGRRNGAAAAAHPKIVRAEAGPQGLRLSGAAPPGSRGRARWWLAAGLALAVVALARPQWGRIDEPVFDQSREILLALDLSRSMLTPDVKPSRLERAKLLIQTLLDRLAGERVGLVVFSGTAFLQSPLSADYEILREFLPALRPDFMPEGGTNYGALIDTAAGAFSAAGAADRFLIVLSDGGATDDDWRGHLGKLRSKGIRVIGLGVGTGAGALIPDGAGGLVKDERGAAVLSRLESGTLRELAEKTGGVYRDAGEWVDLAGLLRATVEAGRKGKFTEKNNVRQVERYQWALAPALLCLLLSFWREFPVQPRPRDLPLGPETDGRDQPPRPSSGRRPAAAILALLLAGGAGLARTAAESAGDPPSAAPLAHIVSRLSAQPTRSAQDWAEFAGETLSWGGRVQSAHQQVPEGPVRDALASVDAGAALDAHAADWPKLRGELEGLLQKPPPQPPQDKKQQQQQQNQQQSQSSQSQQQQQQNQPSSASGQPQNQQQPSAFGGLSNNPPPPPAPDATQKVGGSDRPRSTAAQSDPELAASLEKLDEIKGQDSPAELFQMIENNEPRPKNPHPGKDW
jgi:Ca-activated chloride channel family protein